VREQHFQVAAVCVRTIKVFRTWKAPCPNTKTINGTMASTATTLATGGDRR